VCLALAIVEPIILRPRAERAGQLAVMLLPAEIAVDANRYGVIKFAGNYNKPEVAGKPFDKTEETKPFRFWCNEDDDSGEKDNPGSSTQDYADFIIQGKRDLEDFSRLHLYLGGLHEAVVSGNIKVGLKWKNATGDPSIRIYKAVETDGGSKYLTDDGVAGQQASGSYKNCIVGEGTKQRIGSTGFILPASFWTGLTAENPTKHLLFEGCSEGKGQLVFTFHKADGTEIGEGPGVWMDLKKIKKMYIRSAGNQYAGDPEGVTDDTIVFVHGWRMSPEGRSEYAESFYKRLWHRGFKGRMAAYQWETHWNADNHFWAQYIGPIDAYLSRYNDSEHVAWQSAAGLKTFVNNLSGSRKHVAAHSMGNIVTGEAIRLGMNVQNYALMQAAVPSACFDAHERVKQTSQYSHFLFTMWDKQTPDDDPDPATRALAYRGRFSNLSVNLVSFYLTPDYATFMPWEVNNDQTKPEGGSLASNYRYLRNNPSGQKLYKYTSVFPSLELFDYNLTNAYEAMSYACSTWGKSVGAQNIAQGSLNPANNVNLGDAQFALPGETDPGFGDEHSGQFNARIQQLKAFYNELLRQFIITPNP
jgi:pimeloyl-ACP methyl ester carboxylesterase